MAHREHDAALRPPIDRLEEESENVSHGSLRIVKRRLSQRFRIGRLELQIPGSHRTGCGAGPEKSRPNFLVRTGSGGEIG
jgi:hypothetical protein